MTMNSTAQALGHWLSQEIPLAKAMAMQITDCDETGLSLALPLAENINDKGTGFAGSIASAAALSGWCWITVLLRERIGANEVAVYWSEMHYDKPVRSDFHARCSAPDADAITKFLEQLKSKRKAKLALEVALIDDSGVVGRFNGKYAAWLVP